MATLVGKIKASPVTGAVVRIDRSGNDFVYAQDVDTRKFYNIYPKRELTGLFTKKKLSSAKKYTFIGTFHQMYDDVKMIVTKVTVKR